MIANAVLTITSMSKRFYIKYKNNRTIFIVSSFCKVLTPLPIKARNTKKMVEL